MPVVVGAVPAAGRSRHRGLSGGATVATSGFRHRGAHAWPLHPESRQHRGLSGVVTVKTSDVAHGGGAGPSVPTSAPSRRPLTRTVLTLWRMSANSGPGLRRRRWALVGADGFRGACRVGWFAPKRLGLHVGGELVAHVPGSQQHPTRDGAATQRYCLTLGLIARRARAWHPGLHPPESRALCPPTTFIVNVPNTCIV